MPASGLIALLDDIATIADDVATLAAMTTKKGAALTDNVGTLAASAAKKTTGVVTDDMAVTAEQAVGLKRDREIPVVLAVAKGSMKNKGLILVPGALVLNAFAPWSITPLLMAGGLFLCFEGAEKILHKLMPHHDDVGGEKDVTTMDPEAFEKMRVDGAIRTDLILSAEIIAISLNEVKEAELMVQVAALYVISVVMTVGVYGIVGVLIKLDDAGEYLLKKGGGMAALGKAILTFAPKLMHGISVVGTVAMLLVGGQILMHGFHPLEEAVHHLVELVPVAHGLITVLLEILVGLIAGLLVVIGVTGVNKIRKKA